jgi:hypothetical protein
MGRVEEDGDGDGDGDVILTPELPRFSLLLLPSSFFFNMEIVEKF